LFGDEQFFQELQKKLSVAYLAINPRVASSPVTTVEFALCCPGRNRKGPVNGAFSKLNPTLTCYEKAY